MIKLILVVSFFIYTRDNSNSRIADNSKDAIKSRGANNSGHTRNDGNSNSRRDVIAVLAVATSWPLATPGTSTEVRTSTTAGSTASQDTTGTSGDVKNRDDSLR